MRFFIIALFFFLKVSSLFALPVPNFIIINHLISQFGEPEAWVKMNKRITRLCCQNSHYCTSFHADFLNLNEPTKINLYKFHYAGRSYLPISSNCKFTLTLQANETYTLHLFAIPQNKINVNSKITCSLEKTSRLK